MNALLWYLSKIYCLIMRKFSVTGLHGSLGGAFGGASLLGHVHGGSSLRGTPVFEHSVGLDDARAWSAAGWGWSQEPTSGNVSGMSPRSTQAPWERYERVTCLDT